MSTVVTPRPNSIPELSTRFFFRKRGSWKSYGGAIPELACKIYLFHKTENCSSHENVPLKSPASGSITLTV